MPTYVLASVTRLKQPLSRLVLFVVWIAGAATSTHAASGLSAHNVHDAREIVGEHVQPSRWLPSEDESGNQIRPQRVSLMFRARVCFNQSFKNEGSRILYSDVCSVDVVNEDTSEIQDGAIRGRTEVQQSLIGLIYEGRHILNARHIVPARQARG
jgi:hypothetical protein